MKRMSFFAAALGAALAAFAAPDARAAGTTPLALAVQLDNQGNQVPGCLLYFYVAGTVATPQQVYQDFGLTTPAPNPLSCSAGSRVPQHWLADGLTHLRLTDAGGVVIIDTTMQVLGPSSGGGGGGGGAGDATAVASTGDIKARLSSEVLVGWVMLNGQTIGSPTSGATQRANNDTQNLFVYLWQNCTNAHCPVPGGRGASAIADFNANKQITLPDMRAKAFVGRDCMGTTCAGLLQAANITSGGTDGVDTPGAGGGVVNQTASTTVGQANLPAVNFPVSVSVNVTIPPQWTHSHDTNLGQFNYLTAGGRAAPLLGVSQQTSPVTNPTLNGSGNGSGTAFSGGSNVPAVSSPFSNLTPFLLATYYQKL
jgi:hypothetical protein